jgi:hypothetical protein
MPTRNPKTLLKVSPVAEVSEDEASSNAQTEAPQDDPLGDAVRGQLQVGSVFLVDVYCQSGR